jgi:protease-4
VLDGTRKVLHLLVLLFVLLLVLASLVPEVPRIPAAGALVLAPEGDIVEQLSGDPLERALAKARGLPIRETALKDLVEAIRSAKDDDRVKVLVLQLDGLSSAGLSKLQELADEIVLFKESAKPVVAVGGSFTRPQYYLAAHADEVFMHPMGFVYIDGYSRFQPYYREALDNLLVDFHVWRVGEYKSFVEPITRDAMSEEDREASAEYLAALWGAYQADVTAARELAPSALQRYADNAAELLAGAGGNAARLAVDLGLVDELLTRDLVDERIKALIGDDDAEEAERTGYPLIGDADYLRGIRAGDLGGGDTDSIAVLVASGTILDGMQPPGTVGGESTAALIREAIDDEHVKALVVRVDSPGGSAFASELILRELEVFQSSGRPLVVSMSSVAASGGYWISMSADEIWASPTTITGSIGVGATLPTVPRALDWLGIHFDGLGTTNLAGQLHLGRPLGPDMAEVLRQSIEFSYQQFIGKVAEHREQDVVGIDAIARGRVWTGARAQELDLVDRLGSFDDALASAAELAGLADGEYETRYLEQKLDFAELLALELVGVAEPLVRALPEGPLFSREFQQLLDIAARPFTWVDKLNDPRGLYAYCFCDVL